MPTGQQSTANDGIAERVRPLAERVARRIGCDVVSVRYLTEHGDWVLRVVIDTDRTVRYCYPVHWVIFNTSSVALCR